MVSRHIKIPKHGGPDGQGLPEAILEALISLLDDTTVDDIQARAAIELCMAISTAVEWNEHYRLKLMENNNKQ